MNRGASRKSIITDAPGAPRRSARLEAKRLPKSQKAGNEAHTSRPVQLPPQVEAKVRRSGKRVAASKRKVKALSSSALAVHNKDTADEPLPPALNQWRNHSNTPPISEAAPSTRSNNMSSYDPNLPEVLTRRSIFDEVIPPDPKSPKNLRAIQDAILAVPLPPMDNMELDGQEIGDYSTYCQIIFEPSISESDIGSRACVLFFGIPFKLPGIHIRGGGPKWGDVSQPKLDYFPRPDYIEGISSLLLPEWVEKHLGNYARPIAGVAFPNFIVEHKGGGSMRVAHTQCRLAGAYAARSYYELHGLYGNPNVVLDTALVGTIEFNGDICVGNIHWVSSPSGGIGDLQCHMKRVLCCFTRGLNGQDFVRARRMARNFRAYFEELRVEHFKKLQKLKPQHHPPNYRRLKIPNLRQELESRKLSTKGLKSDLIKRLEEHDAMENTQALESLLDSVSQSHMNSQSSNPGDSFESQRPSNIISSFHSQKRVMETDDSDDSQPLPRTKMIRNVFQ